MAVGNLKEFSEMFAPFDENYALEIAEKMLGGTGASPDPGA